MSYPATPKDSNNIPIGCAYVPGVGFVPIQGSSSVNTDGSGNQSTPVIISSPSVGTDGSAIPTSSTLIGASDGTNLQQLTVESSSNKNLRTAVYNGSNELAVDGSGNASVKVNAALPAGSNTVGNVGLVAGSAVVGGVELVDSAGTNKASISAGGAVKVDGSAVTQPVSGTVTANIGTTNGLALDTSVNGVIVSQGSTTSGEKGPLIQGAVTTSAPSYTTAQTSPISLTTAGAVRIDGSGSTQPVSGTVTANAGTNLNTSALALESGGNLATLAGAVSSSKVQANTAQINGVAPSMGNGVSGTGVQRVTIASDSTGQVALAAGSAVVGGVELVDSGGSNKASISSGGAVSVSDQATGSTSATMQSAAAANGNGTSLTVLGYGTVAFTVSGTFSATVNFEGTEDNSNWTAIEVTPFNSTTPATTTSATGSFVASCAGMQSVRARISGYASGNVTVTAHAVPLSSSGSGGGGGGGSNSSVSSTGASVPGSATYLGANKSGNLTGLSLDGSGNLNVNVAAGGGSGGTSSSFGASFPGTGTAIGASDGTNMQGLLVESSSNKNLRVALYNGSTEASVTGSNALKVDGSAVTQPVSGTISVNALPSGSNTIGGVELVDSGGTNKASISAGGAVKVDNSAVTQPVSAASLPLPTGAATSAKQPALGTAGTASSDVITVQGIASMTALKVDGSAVTQPANVTQFGSSSVVTGTGASGSGIPRVTVSSDSELQLWDSTNGPVAVKAVNTPPALADKALVASLSPNNTGLPVNTPKIVQSTSGKSSGSVSSLAKAFVSNNTQGNSIVVVCAVGNGTAPTISDSASNTYSQATQIANGSALNVAIFYAVNIASGANTITVTNGGTTASIAVEIYEISGLITVSTAQPSVTASATGSSGTASTSAVSALSPNEYAFAGIGVGTAAQTITAGSGWTNDSGQQNPTTPAGLFSFVSMSQYLGSLSPVTPQATFTSEPWAIAVATFRPVLLGVEGATKEAPTSNAALNSVAGSASSVTLFASNPSARGRMVQNDSSASLYLAYAATATTSAYTVLIPPNNYYEMPKPIYTGAVSGIWSSAVGSARTTEIS